MTREQLTAVAGSLRTLEEVMRWSVAADHALVEVITQDEFTHDVVFAAAPWFLVFDTT
jgi:predicted Fe-S protein YdhL (DUF1289 family)